jgi:RimJ/RimL family protein N-acetyltransferase
MKTTTAFAGSLASNDKDLHLLFHTYLENQKEFQKDYGLHKIFHKKFNEYVGVMGLIRCHQKIEGYENEVVEGVIFLKSKYIGSGLGFWAEQVLFENIEKLNTIMIASVWEENIASIKLMKKNGMEFIGQIIKIYKGRAINVDLYIKFPAGVSASSKVLHIEKLFVVKKLSSLIPA